MELSDSIVMTTTPSVTFDMRNEIYNLSSITILPQYQLAIGLTNDPQSIRSRVLDVADINWFLSFPSENNTVSQVKSIYGLVDIVKLTFPTLKTSRKFWILRRPNPIRADPGRDRLDRLNFGRAFVIFEMPLAFSLNPEQWLRITQPYRALLDDYSLPEIQESFDARIQNVLDHMFVTLGDLATRNGGREIPVKPALPENQKTADGIASLFDVPSFNEYLISQLRSSQYLNIVMSDYQTDTAKHLKQLKTVYSIFLLPGENKIVLIISSKEPDTPLRVIRATICDAAQLERKLDLWTRNRDETNKIFTDIEHARTFHWTQVGAWQFTRVDNDIFVFREYYGDPRDYSGYPLVIMPVELFVQFRWRDIVNEDDHQAHETMMYFIQRYKDMKNRGEPDMVAVEYEP